MCENVKCVNFPLCRLHSQGSHYEFIMSVDGHSSRLRLQPLTFSVSLFLKASLCVYPEDYNLLRSWKQKKDLACTYYLLTVPNH